MSFPVDDADLPQPLVELLEIALVPSVVGGAAVVVGFRPLRDGNAGRIHLLVLQEGDARTDLGQTILRLQSGLRAR